MKCSKKGDRWTKAEESALESMAAAGHIIVYAARVLQRTASATRQKAYKLGLSLSPVVRRKRCRKDMDTQPDLFEEKSMVSDKIMSIEQIGQSKEFSDGAKAANDGKYCVENPYNNGTQEHECWKAGWLSVAEPLSRGCYHGAM